MFFKQFFDKHLAQYSYLVGCQRTGESIIIDPIRDLGEYEAAAKEEGLKLTHATETHIHADFFSGIREAANKGLEIFVSKHGLDGLAYENMPEDTNYICEDDVINVGNVKLEVLHTPGHTPESISFLLTDIGGGSDTPMGLFTGDFIFVGDVGRPDLLEKAVDVKGSTIVGAEQMYDSIKKMEPLGDEILIWPGHGAGSPCGKALGAVPLSTLGYERQNNWAFNTSDKDEFIHKLTNNQPTPPNHFKEMKLLNQKGGKKFVPYTAFKKNTDHVKFDIRPKRAYHDGHGFGTINIPYDKNFINQIGFFLDYNSPITLVSDKETDVQNAVHTLQLIGFDSVDGFEEPKNEVETKQIDSKEVTGEEKQLLDVRNDNEWNNGHLSNAKHIPHNLLHVTEVPFNKDETLYVHCQSGIRSSIAVGLLEKTGFKDVVNVKTGYKDIKDEVKEK